MTNESAVQFDTNSRIHMGLAVRSLEHSVAFYRVLLGQEAMKTRPCYDSSRCYSGFVLGQVLLEQRASSRSATTFDALRSCWV